MLKSRGAVQHRRAVTHVCWMPSNVAGILNTHRINSRSVFRLWPIKLRI